MALDLTKYLSSTVLKTTRTTSFGCCGPPSLVGLSSSGAEASNLRAATLRGQSFRTLVKKKPHWHFKAVSNYWPESQAFPSTPITVSGQYSSRGGWNKGCVHTPSTAHRPNHSDYNLPYITAIYIWHMTSTWENPSSTTRTAVTCPYTVMSIDQK